MTDSDSLRELAEWLGIGFGVLDCRMVTAADIRIDVVWNPHEDIAHAWLIVEALEERGWAVSVNSLEVGWQCSFIQPLKLNVEMAPTAPAAIVEAALAVMRGEQR